MDTATRQDYSVPEAAEILGITYRQIDHWLRAGVLGARRPGHRRLTAADLGVLRAISAAAAVLRPPEPMVQTLFELGHIARSSPRWVLISAEGIDATSDPLAVFDAIEDHAVLVVPVP